MKSYEILKTNRVERVAMNHLKSFCHLYADVACLVGDTNSILNKVVDMFKKFFMFEDRACK